MNSSKWTKEQLEAIAEDGCNLLVAAAAGAGKTAVLVERILRKITNPQKPLDIDRLLVVTFTNAAAAEMRERIADAISRQLEENPDSILLQRQLLLLQRASITTIHSFCLEVIRSNFHLIDLDPTFRIADETEAALLKLEALEELFDEKYEQENISNEFAELIECYGGSKDDSGLQAIVLDIYEFIQSHPWPEKWMRNSADAFNLDPDSDFMDTEYARTLVTIIMIELKGMRNMLMKALELASKSEGMENYLENLKNDMTLLDSLIDSSKCGWDVLCDAFSEAVFERLKPCGRNADKDRQELIKSIRNDIKDRIKKLRDDVLYAKSREIIKELLHVYPLFTSMYSLVIEYGEKYASKKREKGIIDFNDIEHFCLKILLEEDEKGVRTPGKAAIQLRNRFEEIYIDEYQDSNEVQEEILKAISRSDSPSPNLFMVGDIKQSIYRFRQAKPELFSAKKDAYPAERGGTARKILLNKNFRSRKEILDAVNFTFRMIMSKNVGEVVYDENEELNAGFEYPEAEEAVSSDVQALFGGAVEVNIIDMKEAEDGSNEEAVEGQYEDSEEELTAVQTEARLVGKRIRELVSQDKLAFRIFDKNENKYRQVRYSDIVILLRTTKNWAEVFSEELTKLGIPVFADLGSGYFKTTEISTVIALLEIIDNPIQDIPMLAVLRSPIAGFSPDDLIDIRLTDKNVPFYEAMKKKAQEEGALASKTAGFLNNLGEWREKALYMSTDELIWHLYDHTGYYSFVGAMPGGIQRQANLRILFERARQFEETSYKGLFNFINFVNKLKSSSGDLGSAKTIGENENVVRIMSIHKSKGLEFPVVIAAGMSKKFNLMDMNNSILLHHELGFGPDYIDRERRITYPTAAKQAIRFKIRLESLSEEMRILYVAMTRAKEKLIMTGAVKDLSKAVLKWHTMSQAASSSIAEYQVMNGKCYMDWICAAIMRHSSGSAIRELGIDDTIGSHIVDDTSIWDIKLYKKDDFYRPAVKNGINAESFMEEYGLLDTALEDSDDDAVEISKRINDILMWKYPFKEAEKVPAKLTVTELKRLFGAESDVEYSSLYIPQLAARPRFMEGTTGMTAAEKGSLMHFVMQHLKLESSLTVEDITMQLRYMVDKELLSEQQLKAVNISKLAVFFDTQLGKRLLGAKKVYRELPFNIELPCSELYAELPEEVYGNQKLLLQGVIDCCFEEGDDLVLLDYKTDFVEEQEYEAAIKNRYGIQLEYYARALEQITGKKVKEKHIYLFWNNAIVTL
ncbi:MAG: helicase-exonuclease AddAB subunit AddA [Bacillota bacterium]